MLVLENVIRTQLMVVSLSITAEAPRGLQPIISVTACPGIDSIRENPCLPLNQIMKTLLLNLLLVVALGTTVRAETPALIPLETIFSDPDIQSVGISPTGRYLTWLAPATSG